jgi:hypothetical protein
MNRQAGLTIVEVVIVAIVLSTVLASTVGVMVTTGDTLASGTSVAALEARANRVLDRVQGELLQAGVTTIAVADPGEYPALDYRRGIGYADKEVVWGRPRRIEFRPAEAVDGIDNDNDGLVDEGEIVWISEPGEPTERVVTLATGIRAYLEGEFPNGADDNGNGLIDERGLSFELQGNTLLVRISVESRDAKGRPLVRTAMTAIRLRN